MSTATKGRRGEHEIRYLFEDAGFYVVRSAGSKGCFDLVAFMPPTFTVEQYAAFRAFTPTLLGVTDKAPNWIGVTVKCGTAKDTKKDIETKKAMATRHGGILLIARRREGILKSGVSRWDTMWA